jgi:hypothetical protein
MKRYFILSLGMLLAIGTCALAKMIDVDVILDLLNSHVSESSIERFVERNQFAINLTADDLIDLKKAGASDQLIEFLQEKEAGQTGAEQEGTQTSPSSGTEEEGYSGAAAYSSPGVSVGFGIGFGFGYPYAYYPGYYYPGYYPYYSAYYPYYPYPCHYNGTGGYYHGGNSGTGVYSYWYRNQAQGRTTSTGSSGGSTINSLSGRVLRTAPASPSAPQVSGGRGTVVSQGHSVSAPTRVYHGGATGTGASRSFHGGMSGAARGFGGGGHGGGRGGHR